LGIAAQSLYDFIWSEYCDWYIELTKPRLYGDDENAKITACTVLNYVLNNTLKLLHPLMPFITEEIWTSLPDAEESIMISKWPEVNKVLTLDTDFDAVVDIIKSVRNIRTEMNVPQSKKTEILILTKLDMKNASQYIEKLASSSKVTFITEKPENEDSYATVVTGAAQCYIPMGELVDVEKELERLTKEKATIEGEIKRAEGKLNNQGFVNKAPQKLIDEEKAKLEKYTEMLKKVSERLDSLKGNR
ncbi:MAG: class I tRNA ligase family protein, partial [Clostridia bacterium]|nr:class I tRNA ligase family protein [Clostridia bacterium]